MDDLVVKQLISLKEVTQQLVELVDEQNIILEEIKNNLSNDENIDNVNNIFSIGFDDDVKYPDFEKEDSRSCTCNCHKHDDSVLFSLNKDSDVTNDILDLLDNIDDDKEVTVDKYILDDNTSAIVDELILLNDNIAKIIRKM